MNDFRLYKGLDSSPYLMHYGKGHDQGGHSGRYPWGSGKNPKQSEKYDRNGNQSPEVIKARNKIQHLLDRAKKTVDDDGYTTYEMSKRQYGKIVELASRAVTKENAAKYKALLKIEGDLNDLEYNLQNEIIDSHKDLQDLVKNWSGDGTELYRKMQEMYPSEELEDLSNKHLFYLFAMEKIGAYGAPANAIPLGKKDYIAVQTSKYYTSNYSLNNVRDSAVYDASHNISDEEAQKYEPFIKRVMDKPYNKIKSNNLWMNYYIDNHMKDRSNGIFK